MYPTVDRFTAWHNLFKCVLEKQFIIRVVFIYSPFIKKRNKTFCVQIVVDA